MAVPSIFAFFLVSHLVILHSAGQNDTDQYLCPESFNCGTLGQIKFPFSTNQRCGLRVNCTESVPQIRLRHRWFEVDGSLREDAVKINVRGLKNLTNSKSCEFSSYFNLPIPTSPFISFTISHNLTLFKCDSGSRELLRQADDYFHGNQSYGGCKNYIVYYTYPNPQLPAPANLPSNCVAFQLPALPPARNQNASDLFSLLAVEFYVGLNVSNECQECRGRGGQCQDDRQEFQCVNQKQVVAGKRSNLTLILATVIPGGVILLLCFLVLAIWCSNNWSYVFARNTSSDPSSKADLEEGGSIYFGVAVFSYTELQEATNNFDPSKELGDGGFGTVYYGKLVDGREVAVKRLYDNNYKRVTQFMNEIEILTRLHHRNLVTLYGCTSRLSRELLLVYEYIPNGTVADHLHGDRAKTGSLPWPIRMNIAIETASALAYLHASDIIHRDVKTNNILLDNNFCVKVADFGLSRLFPSDLTHVSTAPQGTPGYVDPQYHQSYQLTDKSDVYSFGVVLIELISSMPALDISRNEIILANLAVNRIQNRAFNELIDPSLGFESDCSIERMVISVAEMAFRCLQHEKEMRPTMDEVLESLKEIQDYGDEKNGEVINDVGPITSKQPPTSPEQGTSPTRSCD